MTKVNQCLILAAGNGTRLRSVSGGLPKPLVPFRGKPILEHVMGRAYEAGIERFVIVVGYRSDLIRSWLDSRWLANLSVTLVENPDYHKQNGISVLKARDEIRENFMLLMADHLFDTETAEVLLEQPLAPGEVILAVDPNVDGVFDLDDATKVRREGDRIVDIGKEIAEYDALDTGMFLCSPALFDRLESATKDGNCSLSDGMMQLARERRLRGLEIGDARWQDLDTPEALAHAESVFDRHVWTTCRPKRGCVRRIVTGARLRVLAGLFGALLLADLVRRTGPSALLESVATLGWGLILVLALGGVSHLVKTWAWRITLLDEKHHVSFGRMLGLRLSSEAVGQFGVLGQVSGETLRVSLMSSTMPLASGIASVALDRALFVLTAALVSAIGLIAMLAVLPLPPNLSRYAGLSAFLLLGVILVTALAAHRRWPVFSWSTRLLSRVPHFSGWMERKRSLIHSIESKLFDFYHQTPRAFWASFALNLACHLAAVLEVFLILWLMGAKISFVAALATEAWTKMVNILGLFNPGNIGTYEGGTMLVAKMLGLSGAAGLTLGLTRRFRAIFWAAVGGLCLAILSRSTKRSNFESTQSDLQAPRNQTGPAETQDKSEAAGRGHVAVILANNPQGDGSFGSRLPRVGALPVLLRVILGARKAGATRIVVAVDQVTGPVVQRELQSTRRLPESVEWIQLGAAGNDSLFVIGATRWRDSGTSGVDCRGQNIPPVVASTSRRME